MVVIPVASKMTTDWRSMVDCVFRGRILSLWGALEVRCREGLAIPLLKAKPSLLPSNAVSPRLS